jgi:hypothetical protein
MSQHFLLSAAARTVSLRDHGKLWEIGDGLGRDRRIGSRFDSGSLWDEHAF